MATEESPTDTDVLRRKTQERAYAFWESEGRPLGRHLDHWCQAEAETIVSADSDSIPKSQEQSAAPDKTQKQA
jgi:hypothetical protein